MAEENTPVNVMTDEENALVKSVFKGNEALLKSMRAIFFNLEVTENDREIVRSTFKNKELLKAISTRFAPKMDRNTPIGQVADGWLGAETMVFGVPSDTIYQAVHYKDRALKMVQTALELLVNPDGEQVDLQYSPDETETDPLAVNLLARNQYIRHIEKQLLILWVVAERDDIDPKEMQERIEKNSTQ